MSDEFDPYHRWLGIPPKHQPADFYRLLGVEQFEADAEVIDDAAERQIAHVRRKALSQHSALSQKLLNELAGAKACLLDARRKQEYDARLRGLAAAGAVPAKSVAKSAVQRAAVVESVAPPRRPVEVDDPLGLAVPSPMLADRPPVYRPWNSGPTAASPAWQLARRWLRFAVPAATAILAVVALGAVGWVIWNRERPATELAENGEFVAPGGSGSTPFSVPQPPATTPAQIQNVTAVEVSVEPPEAVLAVEKGEAQVVGAGGRRQIQVGPDTRQFITLAASLDGYETQRREVLVNPGLRSEVTFDLKKVTSPNGAAGLNPLGGPSSSPRTLPGAGGSTGLAPAPSNLPPPIPGTNSAAAQAAALVQINSGNGHHSRGEYLAALAHYRKAVELGLPGDNEACNRAAWLLATCGDTTGHDGNLAFTFAQHACQRTNWSNHQYVDTLAAAYARQGFFSEAVKWQTVAADKAPANEKSDYRVRLSLYEARRPYNDDRFTFSKRTKSNATASTAPTWVTVIATGEAGGHTWSYSTRGVSAGWQKAEKPGFTKTGRSPFASAGAAGVRANTNWPTTNDRKLPGEIHLRTSFDMPDLRNCDVVVRLIHDDRVVLFVNGEKLLEEPRSINYYKEFTLNDKQKSLFRKGTNTISVDCFNDGKAAQAIDVGIRYRRRGS